jgi:hypothetical protein
VNPDFGRYFSQVFLAETIQETLRSSRHDSLLYQGIHKSDSE